MREKKDALDSIVKYLPNDLREAYMKDSEFHHLVIASANNEVGYLQFLEDATSYFVRARAKEREEAYKRSAGLMDCAKNFNADTDNAKGFSAEYNSGYDDGRVSMMKQNVICLIIIGIIIAIFN